jgi:hypothetical protein
LLSRQIHTSARTTFLRTILLLWGLCLSRLIGLVRLIWGALGLGGLLVLLAWVRALLGALVLFSLALVALIFLALAFLALAFLPLTVLPLALLPLLAWGFLTLALLALPRGSVLLSTLAAWLGPLLVLLFRLA